MKDTGILAIKQILERKSDNKKGLTIKEMIYILENEYNLSASRNTVKRAMGELEQFGVKIIESNKAHNTSVYYVERTFKEYEIRILLDSLGANKFVSHEDKRKITEKLCPLISERQRRKINSFVEIDAVISENINMILNLERLHQAISEHKEVKFRYGRYDINKTMQFEEKCYQVIPKAIYFYNDRYYLIAYKEEQLRHYRIDRMADIKLTKTHHNKGWIDLKDYGIKHFDMFSAQQVNLIRIRAKNGLIDSVIEKFGTEVTLRADFTDDKQFIFTAHVGIGKGLIRWILKQGKDMEVLYPEELKQSIKQEMKEMSEIYSLS